MSKIGTKYGKSSKDPKIDSTNWNEVWPLFRKSIMQITRLKTIKDVPGTPTLFRHFVSNTM